MNLLYYNDLEYKKLPQQIKKVENFLANGDFQSADVKKIQNTDYYRAKLDSANRLLFKFARYSGSTYILLLELIPNHEYEKSRFLRGFPVDENKITKVPTEKQVPEDDKHKLLYVNPKKTKFHLLDKVVSFDEEQEEVYNLPTPLIIIGSAGSGKTILTLEKLKTLKGKVAYISLSPYLVENAQNIYYSYNFDNPSQEIDFLSFREYIESLKLPKGREITYKTFEAWANRHIPHTKIKEPYRLYEEFKGVLTGSVTEKPYLARDEYIGLGVKQSIFPANQRKEVYNLFEKYLEFLEEQNLYDSNILSYNYLSLVKPQYDFMVVDEVQDITNIQLKLILQSLKTHTNFLLSGDSNQIVHPNFFSWSKVKTMFYKNAMDYTLFKVLKSNYRNTQQVTALSNTLLKIKNTRFGSIDKESTYLINSVSENQGEVVLFDDKKKIKNDLNSKTQNSTKFAVLVMNEADKNYARKTFKTPLVFSIQEAKGLEYENIILLNFVSEYEQEFLHIVKGVTQEMLQGELHYSRARNKEDKDLEVYKFFINSLYVAITRAIKNIYIIEQNRKHPIFELMGLKKTAEKVHVEAQKSDREEWLNEARRLEKQGKFEQAQQIRDQLSGVKYISPEELERLKQEALDPNKTEQEVKRQRKNLFRIASARKYIGIIEQLAELEFPRAKAFMKEVKKARKEFAKNCRLDRTDNLEHIVDNYGVNLRTDENGMTGLMLASMYGSLNTFNFLINRDANKKLWDDSGRNAMHIALYSYFISYHKPANQNKFLQLDALKQIYPMLKTPYIRCRINDQVKKIDSHLMEYFLVNFMYAVRDELNPPKRSYIFRGFAMNHFMEFIEQMPDNILPEYRKKRQYVNSILANNEVERDYQYNKKLFKRIRRGVYDLNPDLELLE